MIDLINIQLSQCPNIGQAEIGTSELLRRAPASIGGLFMLVTWQSLLLSFYGGLLSGSPRACRYLRSGCSKPDSDPRPSIGTESGNKETILGAHYDAINTHSINGIYSRLSTSLHRPGNSLKAFKFLRGAVMSKNILLRVLDVLEQALYITICFGLELPQCLKSKQAGLRNLNTKADNRQGESQSGFLFVRNLSHLLMGVACSCHLWHGFLCSRISENCNAMPTRLRNGCMASKLNTKEAHHA